MEPTLLIFNNFHQGKRHVDNILLNYCACMVTILYTTQKLESVAQLAYICLSQFQQLIGAQIHEFLREEVSFHYHRSRNRERYRYSCRGSLNPAGWLVCPRNPLSTEFQRNSAGAPLLESSESVFLQKLL